MPGEPGPWYAEPQFSAWNVAAAQPGVDARYLPVPAPAWPDTGASFAPAEHEPGGGGVAIAERTDEDLAGLAADRLDQRPANRLAGLPDHLLGLPDEELDAWAARSAEEKVPTPADPTPADPTPADTVTRAAAPPDNVDDRQPREPQAPPGGQASTAAKAADRTRATAPRARRAARKGRVRRRVVIAGICLPAVAVVAAMTYARHPGANAPASAPSPAAPSAAAPVSHPSPSLGRWQHVGTRSADPAPLTLSQLFPVQFTVGKASYIRTAQLGSTRCSRAVFGTKLQAAVGKYGCSQVMRASYLASAQKLMGTIGVLNLSDSAGASRVGKVTGSSQFIAQLTAASGPTHSLAKGTGLEEAEVKGHYLILTWVEFTTLRAPRTASERAQLKAFSADLISGTANVSLTSRMVTGQPRVP